MRGRPSEGWRSEAHLRCSLRAPADPARGVSESKANRGTLDNSEREKYRRVST